MAHHQIHHHSQQHQHPHHQRRHSSHRHHHHDHGAHLPEEHEDKSATDGSSGHLTSEHYNHHHSQAESHHHHHHSRHHYPKHQDKHQTPKKKTHSKASVTSSNSSGSSSSSLSKASSSSSSSDSSSSDSSSSSNSSASSSSKSDFSNSSFSSSSSSSSCSSWSSEASLENAPLPSESKRAIKRPQHSQSCMDISRGGRAFEDDEDDAMPLLEADGQLKKSTSTVKEKSGGIAKKATHSREQNEKGNKGQEQNHAKMAANIRKTKSMEVLSKRVDRSGLLDEKDLEKSKQEAHKNFVKEKIKFSAFLNEITRQVLSPSRLTSLGVTDVHRPTSPGQTLTSPKALSPKPEYKIEKMSKITRSRPGSSASSITSTAHSHVSKRSHSSKHSHSIKHSHSKRHSHSSKTSRSNKHPYSERDLINQQQHQAVPRHRHDSARSNTSSTSSSSKGLSSGTERGHKGQKKHQIAPKEQHFNSLNHRNSHHKSSSSHYDHNENYHSPPSCPCSPESENRLHHSHQESQHHHAHRESHHRHAHPESHHHHSHPESHHHHSHTESHHHHSNPESHHHHAHSESHHHTHPESHHHHSHTESHHHHSNPKSHHHHSHPESHHHHGTNRNPSPHHHSPQSDFHHRSPSPSHHVAPRSPTHSSKSGTHHHLSHPEAQHYPSHKESHQRQHSPSPAHHHHGSHSISEPSHHHSRTKSHHCYSPPPLHLQGEHGSTSHLSSDSKTHHQCDVKLQHQPDYDSSHPKSHHHHHHSHPNHSSNTSQHHHISALNTTELEHHHFHTDSHSEAHQHSHSHDESNMLEHHYHSSNTDSHHSPHHPHHHHQLSDIYPKDPAHSISAHAHPESQDHIASHSKEQLSHLEFHPLSDHDPKKSHPHHFHSGNLDNPPVESDHYHHHKPQESHHYSHSNPHHHSNSQSNHPQHHEHSESHHHSQPDSHHHHSQDHHHYHDSSELQNQHSPTAHHHFHSESNQYHSQFKEDHPNDDHPSHLRHSPVGQRSTSPHSNKSDSSTSSTMQDDQSTVSYQESPLFPKEKESELERLMILQEQNEVLHHSLLQTTVRMECMGSEFKTGHQLLESELRRTRIELNSLLERFTRLQDNYSCTQQTNHLLEKKLHCVAQNMDGERERLNQRISELTDQLHTAKTTIQSLETINVTSMLQDALVKHLKSDEPITPLPVAPPPAQFMDSDRYEKVSMHADEQSLGTLPEEEESDWSEMGEEAHNCVPRGSQGNHGNASYYQWQQRQGCWEGMNQYSKGIVDTESESGGEESKCHQPPHGLKIPHLKFTVHPETLPIPTADVSLARFKQNPDGPDCDGYQITEVRNLGSPIRVLSASLEEIHSIGLLKEQDQQQELHGQLRSNKSMMDLHQTQVGTRQVSYEDEMVCSWREANSHGAGKDINGMIGLESAQKMLNHFIHDGESTHL